MLSAYRIVAWFQIGQQQYIKLESLLDKHAMNREELSNAIQMLAASQSLLWNELNDQSKKLQEEISKSA